MKSSSLKSRFARTVCAVYIVFGLLVFLAFHLVATRLVQKLGIHFAVKEALLEKSKIYSLIQHDLTLSLKMADSPLLKRWAEQENNAELQQRARKELESYRRSLDGKSLFFAISRSQHYYFDDGKTVDALAHPSYTLNPDNVNDAWYYKAIRSSRPFDLNVDYDNHLHITKIWFNVLMKDAQHKLLGVCGSAIDITAFIDNLVNSSNDGTETILFRHDGAITGCGNQQCLLHNSKVRGKAKMTTVYDFIDSATERTELKNALASLVSSEREVKTLHLTVNGKPYLAAISYLKQIGWFNLVLLDTGYFITTHDFLPILGVIIGSILAVVLIIGFLLNRMVLNPLAGLAESSKAIARGNFDTQMPVRSRDEIGSLTRSFNTMTRMVKDYTENLEARVKERTRELDRSNRRLADSNKQLTDSIRLARLIQGSILPETSEIERATRQFFALYRPQNIVGGDFYYFRETPAGSFLALIDCTGHGVPGAFMTMAAKAVLDRVLDSSADEAPAAILEEYNRLIKATLHGDNHDAAVDHGLEIGLCRWNGTQGEMAFAGARIHLLRVTEGRVETIASDKQAIGYQSSREDFAYNNHTILLGDASFFYLASDGFLDQSGGENGWGFGRRRFNQLLANISQRPAAEQQAAIEEALAHYQGGAPQRDDITVIGFSL